MNGRHLNETGLDMFDVKLVEILQKLNKLLLPGSVRVWSERHVHHIRLHVHINVIDCLLAVPDLYLRPVGDFIWETVY